MEHIVKIEGVCKKHGSKQILEDISFTARSGRITAFLGPIGDKGTVLAVRFEGLLDGLDVPTPRIPLVRAQLRDGNRHRSECFRYTHVLLLPGNVGRPHQDALSSLLGWPPHRMDDGLQLTQRPRPGRLERERRTAHQRIRIHEATDPLDRLRVLR